MEFILIFAFSLAIIVPLVSLMHSEYAESKQNLDESQAKQVLDQITIETHNVYYAGYPSRTTLELYFPKGIEEIDVTGVTVSGVEKSELVFKIIKGNTENSLVAVFPFRINVTLNTNDGKRKVLIKAEEEQERTYVNITDFR